ncbi:MAG: hypothetical protein A3G81_22170 [Betaproteobacteria bacterium RIFCSPLOWO2_12_FULL_65_14]|nr:MAG: hypothetical protein A3G81_22170 [Betaproteobacteria bacterium RIFCSPLOWO2_12_FULL_65_14]
MVSFSRSCLSTATLRDALALTKLALIALAMGAITFTPVPSAYASDYPNRPIRLIIGFPPGAAADVSARILAHPMSQQLGQQVVVESRPGAGSSIAAQYVVRAPNDGYTLFLGSSANLTNHIITPDLTFDFTKDFAPISLVTSLPLILVVHPSIGVSTVPELIALAKSKPGQIHYASAGNGSAPHLAGELFNVRAGVKLLHVPYKGSPPAVTDLLAGRVPVMFSPASTVVPHIAAGKLKALASTGAKRPAIAADLPTMVEAGLAGFETTIWYGLMAPAGTPKEVIEKVASAANAALKGDETIVNLRRQGIETIGSTPNEYASFIERELKKWTATADAAGLKQ